MNLKKLIRVAAVAVALVATAQAQLGSPTLVWTNSTLIGVSGALTNTAALDCQNASQVAIGIYSVGANAATTNGLTVYVDKSLIGTGDVWQTQWVTIGFTANGTTPVNIHTNINLGAVRYLRIHRVVSDALGDDKCTNRFLIWFNKKAGM